MSAVNLNDVRLFLKTAELTSISAAAEYFVMHKSKVSRRIHALETSLGMRLLERHQTGVELTNAGIRVVTQYQTLFAQLSLVEEQLVADKNELSGELHISLPINLSGPFAEPLTAFCARYPNIKLHCELVGPSDKFADKPFDIAFIVNRADLPDDDVIARKLATVQSGLFASPSFVAQHGPITEIAQLPNLPCLCTSNGQHFFFEKDNQPYPIAVTGPLCIDNSHVLLQGALQGLGIIRLPDFAAQPYLDSQQLTRLSLDLPSLHYELYMAYKERCLVTVKSKVAIEHFLALRDSNWLAG